MKAVCVLLDLSIFIEECGQNWRDCNKNKSICCDCSLPDQD